LINLTSLNEFYPGTSKLIWKFYFAGRRYGLCDWPIWTFGHR